MRDYYKPGDWNAICDRCGFKFKASELIEDWQGFRVCVHDFETRHPQDFVKAVRDKIYVPWTRIEPAVGMAEFGHPLGAHMLGDEILGGL